MQPVKHILPLALLLLAGTLPAAAAELVAVAEGNSVGAQLRGVRLPESLRKDLVSGDQESVPLTRLADLVADRLNEIACFGATGGAVRREGDGTWAIGGAKEQ